MNSFTTSALSLAIAPVLAAALVFDPSSGSAAGAAPSIEEFASRSRIEDVTISPDGRYLAVIHTQGGRAAAVVIDPQLSCPRSVRGHGRARSFSHDLVPLGDGYPFVVRLLGDDE